MANIHCLPDELLLRILSFVPQQDLESLANASLRWHRVSRNRLQEHKRFRAQYRVVNFETQPECHRFLSKALLTDIAFYVEEVHLQTMEGGYGWKDLYEIPVDNLLLFRSAMESSPYIENGDVSVWMDELEYGDEDPVMAILLPLLPNLHTLTLASTCQGGEMDFLSDVVGRIALDTACSTAEANHPFRKLRTVDFLAYNEEHGHDLTIIARFLALPSVRKITAHCVSAYESRLNICEDFRRDERLPLSQVDSCFFFSSNISAKSLRLLMAAIEGPVSIVGEVEADIGMRLYKLSITRGMSEKSKAMQLESLDLDGYLLDRVGPP